MEKYKIREPGTIRTIIFTFLILSIVKIFYRKCKILKCYDSDNQLIKVFINKKIYF